MHMYIIHVPQYIHIYVHVYNFIAVVDMSVEEGNLTVISAEPIPQQKVMEFVTHPSAGGIAIFIGK